MFHNAGINVVVSMASANIDISSRTTGLGLYVKLLIALLVMKPILSGNVLMPSTNAAGFPSHDMMLSTITMDLVRNGHNVTILTGKIKGIKGFPSGSYSNAVHFNTFYDINEINDTLEAFSRMPFEPPQRIKNAKLFLRRVAQLHTSCIDMWKDKACLDNLKSSNFDLVIVFPFSPCGLLLAHYMNVPFVVFVSTIRLPVFHEGYYGMPYPSSYVPFNVFSLFTDDMSFLERSGNLMHLLLYDIMAYIMYSYHYRNIQMEFDIHRDPDKSMKELFSYTSLVLAHVSDESDFPRPRTPNYITIGGLIAKPPQPLSQDLEDFVQGSGDHGVIIFTLGSSFKIPAQSELPHIFARVFGRLPQRILWKYKGNITSSLSENTRIADWLPQNDILGHPKTRLLIYHGGSNGVLEAIYHGVPMVIIPLMGDQFSHAARVQKKGMGLMLDKSNITEDSLMEVIQRLLHEPHFTERAQHFSRIHHDAPMRPLEKATYWIEHVMKFGGGHLRPRSADMNFIELYMVDVIVVLIIVSLLGLYIDYLILRKLYRCCCCKRTISKKKNE